MALVDTPDAVEDPIWTPWVRLVRHEAIAGVLLMQSERFYTIDVVQFPISSKSSFICTYCHSPHR